MITAATLVYLAAFQICAIPAIVRLRRRQSSADLSVWREWILLAGVTVQLGVFLALSSPWQVWISPCLSLASVAVLLAHVYRYRGGSSQDTSRAGVSA